METDTTLVQKAKEGDVQAFSELVVRHQKSLLRLAYRVVGDLEVAQDVVQESFMKAYQKLSGFEGRSAFKSWVYQITLNTAKNKLRGKNPEMLDIEKTPIADNINWEEQIMSGDLKEIIQLQVDKLPQKQRTALSLRIFEDLSFAEIADIMKCPYDTAKANYRHALMKLRHSLGDQVEVRAFLPDGMNERLEADA